MRAKESKNIGGPALLLMIPLNLQEQAMNQTGTGSKSWSHVR